MRKQMRRRQTDYLLPCVASLRAKVSSYKRLMSKLAMISLRIIFNGLFLIAEICNN